MGIYSLDTIMHTDAQRQLLHSIAQQSIKSGLSSGKAMAIDLTKMQTALTTKRASFVTLSINKKLRGCIGTLEAIRPLVEDVAENAYAAAFSDHRFPPLSESELEHLDIHISILSSTEKISFNSEADLVQQLRPGVDGLIMQEGQLRGTFLPSVWQSLARPQDFLNHLKEKMGLPKNYWSDSIQIQRYNVEEF